MGGQTFWLPFLQFSSYFGDQKLYVQLLVTSSIFPSLQQRQNQPPSGVLGPFSIQNVSPSPAGLGIGGQVHVGVEEPLYQHLAGCHKLDQDFALHTTWENLTAATLLAGIFN